MTAELKVSGEGSGAPVWLPMIMGQRARQLTLAYYSSPQVWRLARSAWKWSRSAVAYTVTVHGHDPIYEELHHWLLAAMPSSRRRALTFRTGGRPTSDAVPSDVGARPAGVRVLYDGSREQLVMIGGHRVRVTVERRELSVVSERQVADFWQMPEKMTFTVAGVAGRDAVLAHLSALAASLAADERPPRLFMANDWGGWDRRDELAARPIDTVVLHDGLLDRLVADLGAFRAQEAVYRDMGLPWHRGVLLWGPPGTGKTSLAKAIAGLFRMDVYFIALAALKADTSLLQLIGQIPAGSMLLLEDIDVFAATQDRDNGGAKPGGVSLAGLLNALDGATTPHGLVTVMTTNRRQVLDEALVRPGRADVDLELGYVDAVLYRRLLDRFASAVVGLVTVAPTPADEVSPAEVVGAIKQHLDAPPAVLAAALDALVHDRVKAAERR